MRRYSYLLLLLMFLVVLTVGITGCGKGDANNNEDLTKLPFLAYEYTKLEVQKHVPDARSAVFPMITDRDAVLVDILDNDIVEVTGTFVHRIPVVEEVVSGEYQLVLKYLGQGRFTTESIEVDPGELPDPIIEEQEETTE